MTLFAINIRRLLVTCLLFWGATLASVYEEGDTISDEHQNVVFEQCYGYDEDGEVKLADYLGKVLWIEISAAWCVPCWETIPEIDDLVLNWIENPNVASFVSLADLDWPSLPTCEEWGEEGTAGIPIIVDGGFTQSGTDTIANWFISEVGGNPAYASYVFIDHTMTVRHKIANNDFSVELANQWIQEMLNEMGDPPDIWGCTDPTAINYNPEAAIDDGSCYHVTDIDGNEYQAVQIGGQLWMKENLKVTHYRNGDEIPTDYSNDDWVNLSTGAYAVYDDDPLNVETYGNLYNCYAVDDSRNIAPGGWHIPTDDEIKQLEMYLGMSQEEADDVGWRGTIEGSKLAGRSDLWNDGNLENNADFGTSGFNLFPGGYRGAQIGGNYGDMGIYGSFWSSTEHSNSGTSRDLGYDNSDIYRSHPSKHHGFSVRCVRDEPDISLVINEIMQNPSSVSDSYGEWIELYNPTSGSIDINEWVISDLDNDSHTIMADLEIPPFGYVILGRNSDIDTNGGVEVDYQYDGITLGNSSDEVIFTSPLGFFADTVAYDGGATFPDPNGASMALLDPDLDNSIGSNWTVSTTSYGDGDLGTPGLPNFYPIIEVEEELEFDTTAVDLSSSQYLLINNTGNGPLIGTLTTEGTVFQPADSSFSVNPYDSVLVEIIFIPEEYGFISETLFISSNAYGESLITIMLSGFGYEASSVISVAPDSLNFGGVQVGLSSTIDLTINNVGDDILVVSNIASDSPEFVVSLNDVNIEVGESAICEVTFTPGDFQNYYGTITIESNDFENTPLYVPLFGAGIEPAPDISVSADTLDFGIVYEGFNSTRPLLIKNIGLEDLEIEEVEFGMGNGSPFSTDFEDATLEPGDSVVVDISFNYTPGRLLFEDIFTIYHNDPDEPFTDILVTADSYEIIIPDTLWTKTFGGSEYDYGYSVQQTDDGGYIITGGTNSFGNGEGDVWLIKTDSNGDEEWNQTFGGSDYDEGYSVQQTTDGGYIITGRTNSFGNGSGDAWLIKTDSDGNEEWNQTFGGSEYDYGQSVQQTDDGGYIITGRTNSFGNGSGDAWLIKTDSNGDEEWNQTFGGSDYDYGYSVQQTTDGGYIITGSYNYALCLIKTDSNGNEEWMTTYGSGEFWNNYRGMSVIQSNQGFIVTGYHYQEMYTASLIILETESNGEILWTNIIEDGRGQSINRTSDNGYIIGGYKGENWSDNSASYQDHYFWLIRLEGDGEPPDIDVSPDSLSSDLFVGDTETQILTITNEGVGDLEWEIASQGSDGYFEDFEAGSLPEGWSSSSNSVGWQFGTTSSSYFSPPDGDGNYAYVNDDAAGSSGDGSVDYLTTPLLDFSTFRSLILKFSSFIPSNNYLQTGTVEASLNSTDWTSLGTAPTGDLWTNVEIDLSGYSGQQIYIRFHANDGGAWATGWAIDNILLEAIIPWVSVNPISGIISTGSSQNVTVTFDATNLEEGEYLTNINILSNDPDEPVVYVPVTLVVDSTSSTMEIEIDYLEGWNLVGLPLEVEDASYSNLFPESINGTLYSFGEGYILDSTLVQGEGYWLRFENTGSTTIDGTPINELTISLNEDWNLVSGLSEDISIYSVFDPDSIIIPGTLYGFNEGYVETDMLVPGKGYWLRSFQAGEVSLIVGGDPPAGVSYSTEIQPIFSSNCTACHGGTNGLFLDSYTNVMAGNSNNGPVIIAGDADNSILVQKISGTANFGGRMPASNPSYFDNNPDQLQLIKDWINEGAMNNRDNLSKVGINQIQSANTLNINGLELFFGIELSAKEKLSYSLPPKPPHGAFDIRFKGDTRIAGENTEIEVMNPSQTLTISYDVVIDAGEHMSWILISESGNEFTLEGSGEITIPTEETFTLERKAIIPILYTLHQNYPNPFNPITSLRYDLPEQAQVTLTVYDLLGREVTQLVNTVQEAGYRSVQWDATNMHGKPVSAGVYLYQIQAGEFVQTRKMVLLK